MNPSSNSPSPASAATVFAQGLALHQRGLLPQAQALFEQVLRQQPRHFDAFHLLGIIAYQNRNLPLAIERLRQAVDINPGSSAAHTNLGNALQESGQITDALASFERAIAIRPDHADAHYNHGNALTSLNQINAALASYGRAVALNPHHADAHYNSGLAQQSLHHYAAALASFDRAIVLVPDHADAYCNRGLTLHELKSLDAAVASFDQAIAFAPTMADAHFNRGRTLVELKRLADALASFERAIALEPTYADAHCNRGLALHGLKQWDAALASLDRAIELAPTRVEAHFHRGRVLAERRQWDNALQSYDRALAIQPDYAEIHSSRGIVLSEIRAWDAALQSYAQALAINPRDAEAYNNCGVTLHELGRFGDALAHYHQALNIDPEYAEAHYNRGMTLQALTRYDEALASYALAIQLKPDCEFAYGLWLHASMQICDWERLPSRISELCDRLRRNEKCTPPFPLLALTDDLSLQRKAAQIWVDSKYAVSYAAPYITPYATPYITERAMSPPQKYTGHRKIRMGYYSGDFRDHAVSYLMAGVFEAHDKDQFECTAFSYGPDTQDAVRQRVERAFTHFVDVRDQSDLQIALLSRQMEIDIAVDLGGFTQYARTGIFALRAAPLQISYIGYLGTMGASYIDYLIADKTIIPDEMRAQYGEKIVHLPSYQANDPKRTMADKQYSRRDVGLPEVGFVYCCFNANYKITPTTFDRWMRILTQVQDSVLLLYADNAIARANLKKEAAARGVPAERLIFAERLPPAEYLARYRVADLFLDTLPYNAGTTASDALWAGLPVLTCMGEAFASRMAASLLNAIDLPELITTTPQQYETLAIALATDPARLAQIKLKLAHNRHTTPLFDTARFTRHLEQAYTQMLERYQAGLAPEHLVVAP